MIVLAFGRHDFRNACSHDLFADFDFKAAKGCFFRERVFKEEVGTLKILTNKILPSLKGFCRSRRARGVEALGAQNNKAFDIQLIGFVFEIFLNNGWISQLQELVKSRNVIVRHRKTHIITSDTISRLQTEGS
ncbi:hypothetical protein D3C87_1795300 [compost metagenome]